MKNILKNGRWEEGGKKISTGTFEEFEVWTYLLVMQGYNLAQFETRTKKAHALVSDSPEPEVVLNEQGRNHYVLSR